MAWREGGREEREGGKVDEISKHSMVNLIHALKWAQMPCVRLVLYSIGSGDVLKLGQCRLWYNLQAGISLGHSPAFPQVIRSGCD